MRLLSGPPRAHGRTGEVIERGEGQPAWPPQGGTRWSDVGPDHATTPDGLRLRTREWPAKGAARARILLVHGIAEHSGRYARTASLLAMTGFDVAAFDLRGFGESGGRRAYVDRWDDYLDDVEGRLAALRDGLPVVLMGHSMGALIALTYALDDRPAPDLLVLNAPALSTGTPAHLRLVAPLLSRVTPRLRIATPLRAEQISSDSNTQRAYLADPLLVPFTTARLGAELLAAGTRAQARIHALRVPTLVTHGSADTLVPTACTEPLGAIACVERRVYPGLRHETLNEPQGPQIVAGIAAWIGGHLARQEDADPRT